MRYASPGETLSFDIVADAFENQESEEDALRTYQRPQLNAKEQKTRKPTLMALRDKIQARIAAEKKTTRKGFVKPTPPRYDALFWKGQNWLDSLAGEPIIQEEGELIVDHSVWKSQSRREPYLSHAG